MKRIWHDWQIEIVRAVYPHVSTPKLAEAMGVKVARLYSMADRLGVKKTAAYLASPEAGRMRRGIGGYAISLQSHSGSSSVGIRPKSTSILQSTPPARR